MCSCSRAAAETAPPIPGARPSGPQLSWFVLMSPHTVVLHPCGATCSCCLQGIHTSSAHAVRLFGRFADCDLADAATIPAAAAAAAAFLAAAVGFAAAKLVDAADRNVQICCVQCCCALCCFCLPCYCCLDHD